MGYRSRTFTHPKKANPMSLSMYQASVPVFVRGLNNLKHVLQKGQAHAKAKNVSDEVVLQSRLIADMLPLAKQVQIATDAAKGCVARLAGVDPMAVPDTEVTLDELLARIDKVIDYVNSFEASQIDGSEERAVVLKTRSGELNFTGQDYLLGFALPNMFFHITTTYAILREAGAELGKNDYLGNR
jgi:uncharacterized protein